MDDLTKRLRDWQTVHPCDADKPEGHLYVEAAAHIEALERQVKAADALAQALRVIESHRRKCHEYDADVGDELRPFDEEDVILMEWQARAALAAYEATKEQDI